MNPLIRILPVILCVVSLGLVAMPRPAGHNAIPFKLGPQNEHAFEWVGTYQGEINVNEGSVDVHITEAKLFFQDLGNRPGFYNGPERLTMVQVGLAAWVKDKPGVWDISNKSNLYLINRMMKRGEEYELSDVKFSIPIDSSIDLKSHWLVFTIGSALPRPNEEKLPPRDANNFCYSHSSHDIFSSGLN